MTISFRFWQMTKMTKMTRMTTDCVVFSWFRLTVSWKCWHSSWHRWQRSWFRWNFPLTEIHTPRPSGFVCARIMSYLCTENNRPAPNRKLTSIKTEIAHGQNTNCPWSKRKCPTGQFIKNNGLHGFNGFESYKPLNYPAGDNRSISIWTIWKIHLRKIRLRRSSVGEIFQ